MKERGRVVTQIINILFKYHNQVLFAEEIPEILSIPELAILSDDQTLPEKPWPSGEGLDNLLRKGYGIAQQDMHDFKRVI